MVLLYRIGQNKYILGDVQSEYLNTKEKIKVEENGSYKFFVYQYIDSKGYVNQKTHRARLIYDGAERLCFEIEVDKKKKKIPFKDFVTESCESMQKIASNKDAVGNSGVHMPLEAWLLAALMKFPEYIGIYANEEDASAGDHLYVINMEKFTLELDKPIEFLPCDKETAGNRKALIRFDDLVRMIIDGSYTLMSFEKCSVEKVKSVPVGNKENINTKSENVNEDKGRVSLLNKMKGLFSGKRK